VKETDFPKVLGEGEYFRSELKLAFFSGGVVVYAGRNMALLRKKLDGWSTVWVCDSKNIIQDFISFGGVLGKEVLFAWDSEVCFYETFFFFKIGKIE